MNMPTEGDSAAPGSGLPDFGRAARISGGPIKPITMATIAKAAGVSQGAISSLLNDRDYGIRVSDRTRERVFKVCRELGYIPNDLRAVVRMYPELGDTCLLVSSKIPGGIANPFVARIAGAVIAATAKGAIAIAHYDDTREYTADDDETPAPVRNGTASKFVCVGAANKSLCAIVHRRSHPIAVLGHDSHIAGTTNFVPDYDAAAKIAFGRLVKSGHKNIAIISGPFGSPEPRLVELNRALGHAAEEFGLKMDANSIFQGDLSFGAGLAATEALATRTPVPTAVFALSEAAGCGVVAAAQAKGLSVPGKLSVLALADHAFDPPCSVPLTTISISLDELAAAAIQEIARQIKAGVPADAQRVMFGVKLCERTSVGSRK